ncbi:pseudouridine synthase-2 [Coleophoma crateriformis]|uniref:tRNA pseudouridine synthase 1 n=1 Tax=Coleophoma crateriformis TaxID=565419 RepID=A0A3D8QUH2_9HELO|nr:pseudouridine synthase-2 [Coleophoma crateriformis]
MADNSNSAVPAASTGNGSSNHSRGSNSQRSRGRGGGGRGRGKSQRGRGGGGGRGRGSDRKKDMGRGDYNRDQKDNKGEHRDSRDDWRSSKRQKLEGGAAKESPFSKEEIENEERKPKRKVAVLIGYAGTGYKGMQINGAEKTIEGDIFKAFIAAGAISKANADDPKKSSLVRCARTDKGVHAAGNVISLKLIVEDPKTVENINAHLPPQIRIWGFERTNGSFSCYQTCDSRWYEYLIPTYSFLPPHPQSYLGKALVASAEKEGVYESYRARQEDVANWWKETEQKYVEPILAKLTPELRAAVMADILKDDFADEDKAVKAQKKPSAKTVASTDVKDESGESKIELTDSVNVEGAEMKTEIVESSAPVADVTQDTSNPKVEQYSAETQGAEVAKAEKTPTNPPVQQESTDKTQSEDIKMVEVDDGFIDVKVAADGNDMPRKTGPTPLEIAIKEVKAAIIAAKKAYRISPNRQKAVQDAFNNYIGTRNFHNYTIQKSFNDPSAKRVIRSFKVHPDPIIINDTEWLSLKVHGQSFMMHQIRKMIAMAALVVRCGSSADIMGESFGPATISIPKAPALGLLLERPVFESYNQRAEKDYQREKIDFDKFEKEMNEFKQREIYDRIFREEEKDHQFHTFFNHLDHYRSDYFLWITASGIAAAKQSKDAAKLEDDSDEEVDVRGEEG